MTRIYFPSLVSISAELNWRTHLESTRWEDLNVAGKWLSLDCRNPAQISGGLAITSEDCIQ